MESHKKTILVVDDFPENLFVLGGILQPEFEIRIALSGAEALQLAELAPIPDLILLDIMMPEMNGFDVCRQLKESPLTRDIPVIFVTAKNEEIDEAKGLEIGAVDYLTKPVSPVIVLARVKIHISMAMARKELEKQNEILRENLSLREEIDRICRHDLRTPLGPFFAVPELLKRGKNLNPNQLELLDMLARSAEKMLTMINDSLDLSRMERGKYQLQPIPVDVLKVTRQVFENIKPLSDRQGIALSLQLDNHPPASDAVFFLPGEEMLFFSMLGNLLRNAVEASQNNQQVGVSLLHTPVPTIEIRNHQEIPPEIQPRFFQKYVTSGKIHGTGLGVYSAHLIAQTLGGGLSFTTSREEGTRLIFTMPSASLPPAPATPG